MAVTKPETSKSELLNLIDDRKKILGPQMFTVAAFFASTAAAYPIKDFRKKTEPPITKPSSRNNEKIFDWLSLVALQC